MILELLKIRGSHNYNSEQPATYYDESIREYSQNKEMLGPQWRYYDCSDLTYKLNDYGYRANNFDTYDWNNSTLFFGCSHVFGTGVHNHHTIPSQYEELANSPSINMGLSGASIAHILHNTHACIEANYIPKQVVIIWPGPIRSIQYENIHDDTYTNIGPWSSGQDRKIFQQYVSNKENYTTKSYLLQRSIIESWRAYNVPVYGFSIEQQHHHLGETGFLVSYPTIKTEQYVDKARDCKHNGPRTNKNWANFIAHHTLSLLNDK